MQLSKQHMLVAIGVVIATSVSVVNADQVYWAELGAGTSPLIQRAEVDGSGVGTVIHGFEPLDIAIDILGGKLYWLSIAPTGVFRADLDGTEIEQIGGWHRFTLDVPGRKIYWEAEAGDQEVKIQRADLDGTNVEDVMSLGDVEPRALTLDLPRGKLYYSDAGQRIRRVDLDGTNPEELITVEFQGTGIEYITLDRAAGKLYWTDNIAGKIRRANLDGTAQEDLVTGLGAPTGIALDVSRGKMYWADALGGRIQRADLDGTDVETVVGFLGMPAGIALRFDCGDGDIDEAETCDSAIAEGEPGACPASCDDGDACTCDNLLNAGTCTARCEFTPITTPSDGDGCCPPGANANNDNDCSPICGNCVCEPGEDEGNCLMDCAESIPTVSEWGLLVITLSLLVGAKICFRRRRPSLR